MLGSGWCMDSRQEDISISVCKGLLQQKNKQITDAGAMRKVLAIAFDFPPRRTSGVYRPTGLIKYLSSHGWMATVLTVRRRKGDLEDATLLERIPAQVRVVRSGYFKVTGWEDPTARAVRRTGALRPQAEGTRASALDRVLRRLGDFVRSCLYFPDKTIGWVPFGLLRAIQLCNEHHFDAVYTTSPPRSAPVIGLLLKLLAGIRWVAEFRDPWYLSPRPWRRKFDRWLESVVCRRADNLIAVTNEQADEIKRSFPVADGKVTVIDNGFDEDDFTSNQASGSFSLPSGFFHLSHFGTIYSGFSGSFFPALAQLLRDRPDWRERLRVNIFGFPDETVRRYSESSELNGVIHLHGFLKHSDAIQAMRSSGCLLLFLADRSESRLVVSGKTYEYLRVGRPILAVTYEGGVKRLIEEGQAGWVVHPEDTQTMKQVLQILLGEGQEKQNYQPIRPDFVAQFRYDRLAGSLASVLDKVVSHVH